MKTFILCKILNIHSWVYKIMWDHRAADICERCGKIEYQGNADAMTTQPTAPTAAQYIEKRIAELERDSTEAIISSRDGDNSDVEAAEITLADNNAMISELKTVAALIAASQLAQPAPEALAFKIALEQIESAYDTLAMSDYDMSTRMKNIASKALNAAYRASKGE